jgi:hypothetical protein
MKVYHYWASAELPAEGPKGKRLLLKKWAGSNESAADARGAAERAVRALKDRLGNQQPADQYAYGLRDIPEELISTMGEKSAVTRNRMGCLVLNTTEMFFADIDLPEPGFFARLRGASRQKSEETAMAQLRQFMEARPSAGARIYRTKGGLRYIFTHAPLGVTEETLGWLSELNSDALYTKLCKEQDCFRARLSPKPWRVGSPLPNRYPREMDDTKSDFDKWQRDYEKRSEAYAVCSFIETVGRTSIHTALSSLVRHHDSATSSDADLPLA